MFDGDAIVPMCIVTGGACAGVEGAAARFGKWAEGWMLFRKETDDGSSRLFWSPDHKMWRVESKSGTVLQLGDDGSSLTQNALDVNALTPLPAGIHRWRLTKMYDGHVDATGRPVNATYYAWSQAHLLTDIYAMPPASSPGTTDFKQFGMHVRLGWEDLPYPHAESPVPFHWIPGQRLKRVVVTAAGLVRGPRYLVRRYALGYSQLADRHHSILASITPEGRCGSSGADAPDSGRGVEDLDTGEVLLQAPGTCPTLPTTWFSMAGTEMTAKDPPIVPMNMRGMPAMFGAITIADYTNDGIPDAYFPAPPMSFLYPGDGVGGFLDPYKGDHTAFAEGIPGDWTGDGRMGSVKWDMVMDPESGSAIETFTQSVNSTVSGKIAAPVIATSTTEYDNIKAHPVTHRAYGVDVNGDGLPDIFAETDPRVRSGLSNPNDPKPPLTQQYLITARLADGSIVPDGMRAMPANKCELPTTSPPRTPTYADIDGDGIVDKVESTGTAVTYARGLGNGSFGVVGDCYGGGAWTPITGGPTYDRKTAHAVFHDVNGDGLADMIVQDGTKVYVAPNVDGHMFSVARTIDASKYLSSSPVGPDHFDSPPQIQFADVNGNGTDDLVLIKSGSLAWDGSVKERGSLGYVEMLQDGRRPYSLTAIANGYGLKTSIEYTSTSRLEANAVPKWTRHVPQNRQVVQTIVTDNGQTWEERLHTTVEYAYANPVYDARERTFRGFQEVNVDTDRDTPAEVLTKTTYAQGGCDAGEARCQGVVSNPYAGMTSLPVQQDISGPQGRHLVTTHTSFTARYRAKGLDGRIVRAVRARAMESWIPDANLAAGSVQRMVVDTDNDGVDPVWNAFRVMELPATPGMKHLRSQWDVDENGNETRVVDFGNGDLLQEPGVPTPPDDVPIVTVRAWAQVDPSGENPWIWREQAEQVSAGDAQGDPTGRRRVIGFGYDAAGGTTSASSQLTPDDVSYVLRDTSRANAGQPATASQAGATIASYTDRDMFGNVTAVRGPLEERQDVAYDDAYKQLATLTTQRAGRAETGYTTLTSTFAYDRGLGKQVSSCGATGACATKTFDGFGRLIEASKPDADIPGASTPSLKVEYDFSDAVTQRVHMTMRTDEGGLARRNAYRWFDGAGRTLGIAEQMFGDRAEWVVRGLSGWDLAGRLLKRYVTKSWMGEPIAARPKASGDDAYVEMMHGPFNRVESVRGLDGKTVISKKRYRPLETDVWDANKIDDATALPTTSKLDGHGRLVATVEHVRDAKGTVDDITTEQAYFPTGEVRQITKHHSLGGETFTRTFRYDGIGRLVSGEEPNTGNWLYAYDDAGRLVGTSDARGCGKNLAYDAADRLVYEDFSPCQDDQQAYSAPNAVTGMGTESFYQYDAPEAGQDDAGKPLAASQWRGKLTSVRDRASYTRYSYDARGRTAAVARRLTKQWSNAPITGRYTGTWFKKTIAYDEADRPIAETTGADVGELLVETPGFAQPASAVLTHYDVRGEVDHVGSSYGTLMEEATYEADGSPHSVKLGDIAQTTTWFEYANEGAKRVKRIDTERANPSFWTSPPAGYVPNASVNEAVLADTAFTYDKAGNPKTIEDRAAARGTNWPVGAKPVTQTFNYDDAHRVTRVDYDTKGDTFVDPAVAQSVSSQKAGKRVGYQTFAYDYLGNITRSDDNEGLFYDRSLGAIRHGSDTAGPNQIQHAELGGDSLDATYDLAGNMTSLMVVRAKTCMSSNGCVEKFEYAWDEVGRMARAKRTDWTYAALMAERGGAGPKGQLHVNLYYAYDAGDQRVLSWNSNGTTNAEIFPSLRLMHAKYDGKEYERTALTERVYLASNGASWGEVLYTQDDLPTLSRAKLHVLFNVTDGLGSTAFVIDKETSEIVERRSYQAFGGIEADFRPDRWKGFRETYGFTGKEEDVELGLMYFGQRYYQSQLGRWISADPLTIHAAAADLNPYAYVHGRVSRMVDPNGLEDMPKDEDKSGTGGGGGEGDGSGGNSGGDNGSAGIDSGTDGMCEPTGGAPKGCGDGAAQRTMVGKKPPGWEEQQHAADRAWFTNSAMGSFLNEGSRREGGIDGWSVAGSFAKGLASGLVGSVLVAGLFAMGPIGVVVGIGLVAYGSFELGATITSAVLGHDMEGNELSDGERADMAAEALGGVVGGAVGGWGYGIGKEFKVPIDALRGPTGKPMRVAPWGNRTGHEFGERPHYHRAIPNPRRPGGSMRGQGLGNHRPWEGGW